MVTVATAQKVATKASGKSGRVSSGKPQAAANLGVVAKPQKVVAKPEVESSGKTVLSLMSQSHDELLPLTGFDDFDVSLGEEITEKVKSWRWEKNSNGYYRWRWQMKDDSGKNITYETKSGRTGYKRGSRYVSIDEAKDRIKRDDYSTA